MYPASTRVTRGDVRKAFERFGTAAKMAGLVPPDGYEWTMAEGDADAPYSLFWRNTSSGALESATFLPQFLGTNAREAWSTLHSYAHLMFAMKNNHLLRDDV